MFDRREKNAEIFQDTARQYCTDNELKDAIKKSIANQIFIGRFWSQGTKLLKRAKNMPSRAKKCVFLILLLPPTRAVV